MELTDIISRIRVYCRDHDVGETTFGRKAVNDGKLLGRLERGRTITLDTLSLIQKQLGLPADRSAWSESRGPSENDKNGAAA